MTAIEQITAATANELDTITANLLVTSTIMQQVAAALEEYVDGEEYDNDDPEGSSVEGNG